MKHSNTDHYRVVLSQSFHPGQFCRTYDDGRRAEVIHPRGRHVFNPDGSLAASMAREGWVVLGSMRED